MTSQRLFAAVFALATLTQPLSAQYESDSLVVHGMAWGRETFLLSEVLELAAADAERLVLFDLLAWTGGPIRRLWFKADGNVATVGRAAHHGEYQVLYGRLVSPFWDAQVGLRFDLRSTTAAFRSRGGVVVGLQGLAPGSFELEPSLYVGTDGNVSLDLTGSYDLYVAQRLVLQPRLEASAALRDAPKFGIGAGISSATLGVRARYEIRREIAPYLGVLWERGFGRTAELARLAGSEPNTVALVAGVRLWR